MSNVQALREWERTEKERGLVGVHLCFGPGASEMDLEALAGELLAILTSDGVDVSEDEL